MITVTPRLTVFSLSGEGESIEHNFNFHINFNWSCWCLILYDPVHLLYMYGSVQKPKYISKKRPGLAHTGINDVIAFFYAHIPVYASEILSLSSYML